MKYQKIMLIKPSNTISNDSVRRLITPFSLLYIGAVLRDNGYDVKILDSTCEGYHNVRTEGNYITYGLSDEEITRRIREYSPDIVGITAMFSSQQNEALYHCDLVKSVDNKILVVMGGIHSSLFPRETIQRDSVDFVIMGEGEFRFLDLINLINKGKKDFEFDGITYQNNGKIIINPMKTRIEDLDALPLPARDLIDMEKYIEIGIPIGPFTRKDRVEQIMTSRGCPFHCVFCSAANYFGHKFRMRSIDNIMKEVDLLVNKYDIQEIQFTDDNLTMNKKRAKELFMRLKKYNLSWCTPNGVMVKTLDEEMIKLMADSGAYQVTFAIESGNERVLKEIIHKQVPSKNKIKKLVELSQKYNIQVHGTLIIGFPGETKEEIFETLNYPFEVGFNSVSYFILNPIPGSEIYIQCKAKGYLISDAKMDVKSAEINIPESSPDYVMSREELVRLVDDKTREFNEWAKATYPNAWDEKFKRFLKKHDEQNDLIIGRVT